MKYTKKKAWHIIELLEFVEEGQQKSMNPAYMV